MRIPVLLLLLLPLHAFAQYRPSYSPPRPSYTPAPSRPGPSPMQVQHQSQQQAHQNFQRMQTQQAQQYRTQQTQQATLRQQQQFQQQRMRHPLTQQQLEEQQAKQHEADEQATDYLAHLAQDQQAQRLAHPAPDAPRAAAQQQEDARQLTLATVKTYREVFLPGQVSKALQARMLAPKAQNDFQAINKDVLDNAWWSKQDPTQVNGKIAAHAATLSSLTTELLGFDLASPPTPPATGSPSTIDAQLATGSFDQAAATQLVREAAQAEKAIAGARLAKAVTDFNKLATASPELQPDPKKRRDEVKASLRKVDQEMQRYTAQVGRSAKLYDAQKALLKSTSDYLAKNEK